MKCSTVFTLFTELILDTFFVVLKKCDCIQHIKMFSLQKFSRDYANEYDIEIKHKKDSVNNQIEI